MSVVGIDLSTQGVKLVAINTTSLRIIDHGEVSFARDLQHHGIDMDGVIKGPHFEVTQVSAPPPDTRKPLLAIINNFMLNTIHKL